MWWEQRRATNRWHHRGGDWSADGVSLRRDISLAPGNRSVRSPSLHICTLPLRRSGQQRQRLPDQTPWASRLQGRMSPDGTRPDVAPFQDPRPESQEETEMHGTLAQFHELERRAWSPPKAAKTGREKVVNLALQGGGSHGAFTWGVLDRLLEEKRSPMAWQPVVMKRRGARSGISGKGYPPLHRTASSSHP